MSWQTNVRAFEASERRQVREAQKRQRDLERRTKEQAKLSAIEQARLEVETYENRLEVLLSLHKESGPTWDWQAVAAALPPPRPEKRIQNELRLRQNLSLLPADQRGVSESLIEQAKSQDEQDFRLRLDTYSAQTLKCEKLRMLAQRILAGEHKAYTEALVELSPLAELSSLGSTMHFIIHDAGLLETGLTVSGLQVIPSEVKTLTASEKLSVKPMPKARYHELYQDYICSCMLRVAREIFALLPVHLTLVTASAEITDPRTGHTGEHPVLSAAISRTGMGALDLENVDPSEGMGSFICRGDFRASRKAGAFAPIFPLTLKDLPKEPSKTYDSSALMAGVRSLREGLRAQTAKLTTSFETS